jgi:RHH-type proline utilization regulon transcriptional repressor/proline dehydrogenase/delta 1-pyrroline-5-carboxylate dehydrogenase
MHPSFATAHLSDETDCVNTLLSALEWDGDRSRRVGLQAEQFIRRIRDRNRGLSEIETFLEHYPLDSPEGLALMTLAEALLRIPDSATADALIAEKMSAGSWAGGKPGGSGIMKLAGIGMNLAQKTLGSFLSDLGRPLIRKSMEEAIKRIGQQFVVGENIAAALSAARKLEHQGYRMSYDMLGEGARTSEDAGRYFETYAHAADVIGKSGSRQAPGMSVKLSALHPRYHWTQRDRCVPDIIDPLSHLCRKAADSNISLTVDAEEADRLEMSWEIISAVAMLPELRGWDGFGLAIQAYDKRCFSLIDAIGELATQASRRIQVRLVKGAYWDTEIKRAQVAGLPDYPVFTRKENTDLSYLAGARKLLGLRDRLYPMFATHNAHTVAAVLDMAGADTQGFEFQRLYGMGGTLHDMVLAENLAKVTVYAPVGSHEDLLPYLVRRMLENGANTSFVQQIRAKDLNDAVFKDPVLKASENDSKRHPRIPLPQDIYGPQRRNSAGLDLSADTVRTEFLNRIPPSQTWRVHAVTPIIKGEWPIKSGSQYSHMSPAHTGEMIAEVWDTTADRIESSFDVARQGFREWSKTSAAHRAKVLRLMADLLELNEARLVGLLQHEGGKTIADAISEVREAVDFCRYYAAQGEILFAESGTLLPGPTGEENRLVMDGRGVFVCISPWNFPLAIFLGQIAAALMAGNSVIAKPAEQTPVIAFETVRLLLAAGVPPAAITLLPGDGRIGAALVGNKAVDGVAFTGSVEVARLINRALAAKDGAIAPLIAETGGQNAMVVDSTALPEQVVDDVMLSAFGSTGQRCSALRVLYVQDDIADKVIGLLRGALQELRVGDPRMISTDTGPVIDADALKALTLHVETLKSFGKLIGEAPAPEGLNGWYIAPVAYEIDSISRLPIEVFGPVLHVIRYAAKDFPKVIRDINSTGYGLTFGMHSRLQQRTAETARQIEAGNIYINRSMIGAVVGVQPFGGRGFSGTGPKAGGPHYLQRFANEKTITVNTVATGGNVALLNAIGA